MQSGAFQQLFPGDPGDCRQAPFALAAGAECALYFSFTPSADQAYFGNLFIAHDGILGYKSISIIGTAIPRGITYTPSLVDYGYVVVGQTSETKAVRFTGSSGTTITALDGPSGDFSIVSIVGIFCPSSFPVPVPITLPFDVDCTFNIAFTPSVEGAISQDVEALTNASTSPDSYSLGGMGIAVAPAAPAITALEVGDGEIQIRFSTNGDGGSPITGYVATCGNISAEGAGSPITVTGLQNDTSYSCSVVAANSIGSSAPSANVPGTPEEAIKGLNIILIKAALDAQ
jgi:hypothetical protein